MFQLRARFWEKCRKVLRTFPAHLVETVLFGLGKSHTFWEKYCLLTGTYTVPAENPILGKVPKSTENEDA